MTSTHRESNSMPAQLGFDLTACQPKGLTVPGRNTMPQEITAWQLEISSPQGLTAPTDRPLPPVSDIQVITCGLPDCNRQAFEAVFDGRVTEEALRACRNYPVVKECILRASRLPPPDHGAHFTDQHRIVLECRTGTSRSAHTSYLTTGSPRQVCDWMCTIPFCDLRKGMS
jgi:hypothetical protein